MRIVVQIATVPDDDALGLQVPDDRLVSLDDVDAFVFGHLGRELSGFVDRHHQRDAIGAPELQVIFTEARRDVEHSRFLAIVDEIAGEHDKRVFGVFEIWKQWLVGSPCQLRAH